MDYHLKQSLARVAHEGKKLSENNYADEALKISVLQTLIYETQEMLQYAVNILEAPDTDVSYLKDNINNLNEDGELAQLLLDLEEPDDNEEHRMGSFESGVVTGKRGL